MYDLHSLSANRVMNPFSPVCSFSFRWELDTSLLQVIFPTEPGQGLVSYHPLDVEGLGVVGKKFRMELPEYLLPFVRISKPLRRVPVRGW